MATFTETIELKDEVSGPAKDAAGSLADVGKSFAEATGSGAGLQTELAELTGGLSLVAEAAGVVVLALSAVVAAGAAFAIKSSEAKDASIAMFNALGRGRVTGEQVDDMLDHLRGTIGLTKDELAPLASKFLAMGITGKDQLEKLTTAAASANATIKGSGDAFANLYKKLTAQVNLGQPFKLGEKSAAQLLDIGLDVNDLAKRMGVTAVQLGAQLRVGLDPKTAIKFGDAMQEALIEQGAGPLAVLSNSSKNLGGLLREYIGDIFEDLGKDIQPFMAEVKSLFEIFSQAQPSGQALKSGIGGFFKQVFATATIIVPYIKHFLLDLVILGLKAYIALKPIAKYFKDLWANHDGLTKLKDALAIVGVVLIAVAAAALLTLAPFIIAAALFGVLVAAVVAVGVAFVELAKWISGTLMAAGTALSEWVASAADTAKNFIAGLVNGISNGASLVVDAVKGLAKGAMNSITGALGIHSPSTVMMQLGGHTADGFAQGLDSGAGDVQASAGGLANATVKGVTGAAGAAGAAGTNGSGEGGVHVNVEPGAIVIQGGSGQGALELTEEAVSMIFERVALGAGL